MDSSRHDALILVKPSEAHKEAVQAYRDEFVQDIDSLHGSAYLGDAASFEEWLQTARRNESDETVQKGFVPASEYLAVRKSNHRLVGMVNIRHRLNDVLEHDGGHIGYSVRESERHKGYATQILKLALGICADMGIDKVLLTCDSDNSGSARVITANGGVLQEEFMSSEGKSVQRYLITT